jgi:hypothetical protein
MTREGKVRLKCCTTRKARLQELANAKPHARRDLDALEWLVKWWAPLGCFLKATAHFDAHCAIQLPTPRPKVLLSFHLSL